MNEREAIDWLNSQLTHGIKPGLSRVQYLLEQLGNPQNQIKTIHVAGTNGKGTTTLFLNNMLEQHGYKVGSFTSPYIETMNERISINKQPVNGCELAELVTQIQPICEEVAKSGEGPPTEFEIITVMAYVYFAKKQVDYAIIEVGLGGRLDSTNVIQPIISIITTIGYDHVNVLGNSLGEITQEKAGIIKENVPVITGVKQEEAQKVIQEVSRRCEAPVKWLNQDFHIKIIESTQTGETFDFTRQDCSLDRVQLSMCGHHQIENAALAIESFLTIAELEGGGCRSDAIYQGLNQSYWPGRFEYVQTNPDIIFDGAHNVEAVKALIETINERYDPSKVRIICAFVKNKPIDQILSMMSKNFTNITLTTFDFLNNCGYYELNEKYENYNVSIVRDWKITYDTAVESLDHSEVLVVTGSLYFVSEIKRKLKL
ncbi:folylpolyglutamate synthase/dihydrofolate synthase family protein [Alkalibacillus silvisoli]|uniref:tetrahydrofolate synthase n=1 Tax=Alkalibacillus silvisoli TaxID=392823 RepID=A0ABN0ZSC6_9BACI